MSQLKHKINEILLPLFLDKSKKIIYLDYPIHFNIGDLAIYHGTEVFFAENKIDVLERFNIHNISYGRIHKLIKKYQNIIFVWHGGGNMGDTYFNKAELKRRNFMRMFPNEEIIFFPQSIFYKEKINIDSSIEFYNRPNIKILVRDNESFDLVTSVYPLSKKYLCPDMAFYLEETDFLKNFLDIKAKKDMLTISRIDEEKIDMSISHNITGDTTDWLLMTGSTVKLSGYFIAGLLRLLSFFGLNSGTLTLFWYKLSKHLLSKGFLKISLYTDIKTDRLHGFIMSYLLNKNISTSDNYYGKIRNYRNTWSI